MLRSVLLTHLGAGGLAQLFLEAAPAPQGEDLQHVYVVRHGDKYHGYPDCTTEDYQTPPCYNHTLMGDNSWLTPCGVRQANIRAQLLADADLQHIVVSPWARTLQTALPLAKSHNLKLKVEYLLSEARQPEGPFRPFNAMADQTTKDQLAEAHSYWDLEYGSPPIQSPEDDDLYVDRVRMAGARLRARFPPSSGNVAVVTHATPAFSVAYGLCYGEGGSDQLLQQFIEGQTAIGPAGMIHIVRDQQGHCVSIGQTDDGAHGGCGATEAYKCNFEDDPSWYWGHSEGRGPGLCA